MYTHSLSAIDTLSLCYSGALVPLFWKRTILIYVYVYVFSNQVATGDAWASEITRPLFSDKDSSVMGFFFIYTVIGQTLLINVVVAVSQSQSERERESEKERDARARTHKHNF